MLSVVKANTSRSGDRRALYEKRGSNHECWRENSRARLHLIKPSTVERLERRGFRQSLVNFASLVIGQRYPTKSSWFSLAAICRATIQHLFVSTRSA
jgi:hypothetical protein